MAKKSLWRGPRTGCGFLFVGRTAGTCAAQPRQKCDAGLLGERNGFGNVARYVRQFSEISNGNAISVQEVAEDLRLPDCGRESSSGFNHKRTSEKNPRVACQLN